MFISDPNKKAEVDFLTIVASQGEGLAGHIKSEVLGSPVDRIASRGYVGTHFSDESRYTAGCGGLLSIHVAATREDGKVAEIYVAFHGRHLNDPLCAVEAQEKLQEFVRELKKLDLWVFESASEVGARE